MWLSKYMWGFEIWTQFIITLSFSFKLLEMESMSRTLVFQCFFFFLNGFLFIYRLHFYSWSVLRLINKDLWNKKLILKWWHVSINSGLANYILCFSPFSEVQNLMKLCLISIPAWIFYSATHLLRPFPKTEDIHKAVKTGMKLDMGCYPDYDTWLKLVNKTHNLRCVNKDE